MAPFEIAQLDSAADMSVRAMDIGVPLHRFDTHRDVVRSDEPIRVGVPFARGVLLPGQRLVVQSGDRVAPCQILPLSHWSDGSIRWVLVDFQTGATDQGRTVILRAASEPAPPSAPALKIVSDEKGVVVETGALVARFVTGKAFPVSAVTGAHVAAIDWAASGLGIDIGPDTHDFVISRVSVEEAGPLRTRIRLTGTPSAQGAGDLEVEACVELFAGCSTLRIRVTCRNVAAADHPRGIWTLGDSRSLEIRSMVWALKTAVPIDRCSYALEPGDPPSKGSLPFRLHQESSGGERWNSPVHRTGDGRVPLRFRGYSLRSGDTDHRGERATPTATFGSAGTAIRIAVPRFWQAFPGAIAADGSRVAVELLPEAGYVHELQPGEQLTREFAIGFGVERVSEPALDWIHRPQQFSAAADYVCSTGAAPYLPETSEPRDPRYEALVRSAIEGPDSFFGKRDSIDEYGWRNFGDLYADHEAVSHTGAEPLVSHYNNQYDAIAGFAVQFMRSGDPRWWELMNDLAQHVRDIDVYHTSRDKSAYNGGLFWHTYHYTDAGTATHRTYPREMGAGGGPSAEHNYSTGLMLHYYLTGDVASRDAAVGLADWVLRMDDGQQTVFRWLADGATGLASASGDPDYHGPGRGAANSIVTCLNAHRLTGDRRYLAKSEELIRRCIHPSDDVPALDLQDAERRWYYTVFLQALHYYLKWKANLGEYDASRAYAREALLHYARWMADHEKPYLDTPERLEYPTETWAAQDMRKAEVFAAAKQYASPDEQARFGERARFFFDYSVRTLSSMPTRSRTRPVVLMLLNGLGLDAAGNEVGRTPGESSAHNHGQPARFETQKRRAVRRAQHIAAAATAALLMLALWSVSNVLG